ncbi:dihydrofolate reductase family protein [Prauserella muralis]|uniref:Deaminase n=1 Tax=Prauserella muralis TaxID=588067 RepID=A0A2V4B1Y9_9PSEU|nr:dihydrofolate reductase family protein [Prauserella muralis]PXY22575.1 deaminase [Prauserella muralis]TWE28269.1 dihydrofolate reductase [Prauserella muralis]
MSRGNVVWHVSMSLDGFIAGPNHEMDWTSGMSLAPGTVEESVAGLGAILAGRRGFDAGAEHSDQPSKQAYGGAFDGPVFVLTHHPEDAKPDPGITFLTCDIAEAVRIGLDAAGGKNLEVFGADIARQCVQRGLVDEFYVHLAPVMLGDGIRLFDCPGIEPVRWHRVHDGDPLRVVDLRYRPATRDQAG